jgi:hypothetical protein
LLKPYTVETLEAVLTEQLCASHSARWSVSKESVATKRECGQELPLPLPARTVGPARGRARYGGAR